MSETRKRYLCKLVGRCMVFALCAIACVRSPEVFRVLEGWNFFREISWLHVLWLLWMADMLPQLIPYPNRVPLGSTKLFARRFRPGKITPDPVALRSFIRKVSGERIQAMAHSANTMHRPTSFSIYRFLVSDMKGPSFYGKLR